MKVICPECKGEGWLVRKNGEVSGAVRCACFKPKARLIVTEAEDVQITLAATKAADLLGAMPDYPSALDPMARDAVCAGLVRMCSSPEQVMFVQEWALIRFTSWKLCGIPGLRQILVSMWPSRDGIDSGPAAISELYPQGFPSVSDGLTGYGVAEGQKKQLQGPAPNRIDMAPFETKRLPLPEYAKPPEQRAPRPIPVPEYAKPSEGDKPITQADIDEAVRKHIGSQANETR
jgi:hypothetical protein